ncbi:iron-sulfur cluster biosynthesis family protein [Weissella viridescens]|uniref:Iron-sulfur cluster biosynthesis family protein n=1 Tax=Weissella viridescens TaxID=1629 RepID=A0A3P2RG98_WEIVI|nr:iron-sulfur cluster biosynthesis family protein [Weissella viridescens]RRG17860.1 iron-sulfur cluster biosynthesis family protein [Weissella viridescens]
MHMTISEAVVAMITAKENDMTRLVLDFDDGVGPFSKQGICSLNTAFQFVLARPDQVTGEFDATLTSNLGSIAIKGYAIEQLDPEMTLTRDQNFNLVLAGNSGSLDNHLQLVDAQTWPAV